LVVQHPQQVQRIGVSRLLRQDFLVQAGGWFELPGLMHLKSRWKVRHGRIHLVLPLVVRSSLSQ
jgi:hypothetical protein